MRVSVFAVVAVSWLAARVGEAGDTLLSGKSHVALSAVKDKPARAAKLTVRNPLDRELPAAVSIEGADATAFSATNPTATLGAGKSMEITIVFTPVRGAARYSASLRVGTKEQGVSVLLQGIGIAAFEGKNEPPLEEIVHALGIPLDVGGSKLELDTKADTIGASVDVRYFAKADEGKVRITPLARFSPPGATPFGMVAKGGTALLEAGKLATSESVEDAHQCLFPPLEGGKESVEIEPPAEGFAFYLKAHQYVSFTDPELPTAAKIAHTARVYPAVRLAGRDLKNSYVIGFEEAANGDYQDALFLLENVKPAP